MNLKVCANLSESCTRCSEVILPTRRDSVDLMELRDTDVLILQLNNIPDFVKFLLFTAALLMNSQVYFPQGNSHRQKVGLIATLMIIFMIFSLVSASSDTLEKWNSQLAQITLIWSW